jgi:hypothetical protein
LIDGDAFHHFIAAINTISFASGRKFYSTIILLLAQVAQVAEQGLPVIGVFDTGGFIQSARQRDTPAGRASLHMLQVNDDEESKYNAQHMAY